MTIPMKKVLPRPRGASSSGTPACDFSHQNDNPKSHNNAETARSQASVIHELDLAVALNEEKIAGAGLDVLSVEPPPVSNPLLTAKNCLITPHIAWASRAARQRLIEATSENVRGFVDGSPQNVVV